MSARARPALHGRKPCTGSLAHGGARSVRFLCRSMRLRVHPLAPALAARRMVVWQHSQAHRQAFELTCAVRLLAASPRRGIPHTTVYSTPHDTLSRSTCSQLSASSRPALLGRTLARTPPAHSHLLDAGSCAEQISAAVALGSAGDHEAYFPAPEVPAFVTGRVPQRFGGVFGEAAR